MRVALAAFVLFLVGNLVLGERFPFSRYDMYAAAGGRTEGAVPVWRVDGRPVSVKDLDQFDGIDPGALLPPGIACSLEYEVHDAARWIASHRGTDGTRVKVTFGYRILRVEPGRLTERWLPVAEGTARRR